MFFRLLLPFTLSAIFALSLLIQWTNAKSSGRISKINIREEEKKILNSVLKKYDKQIRPGGLNKTGATHVKVNLFLRSISKIDDYAMKFSVQLTFREEWLDNRLRFEHMNSRPNNVTFRYLTLTDSSKVWMPDLFFRNENKGNFHNLLMPNEYVRIHPNGTVLYSLRISLMLSCPMDLKLYPLDKQLCSLSMASYGWTTDDLIFKWEQNNPVQITKDLFLPRFSLEYFVTGSCDSVTTTGSYSCLKMELLFRREFSYYMIQIYIPSCMLVIVSWVSFWLDQGAVQARISLGVTTLLTMATQTSGINQNLPPVSYTKALDVWTGVCLLFVFSALLEFALVNYASRADNPSKLNAKRERCRRDFERAHFINSSQMGPDLELKNDGVSPFFSIRQVGLRYINKDNLPPEHIQQQQHQTEIHLDMAEQSNGRCKCCGGCAFKAAGCLLFMFPSRAKRIDVVSRVLFPLIFALFNLAYWLAYLRKDARSL